MTHYIRIFAPLARALWSLESTKANASDVYVFWLAMGSALQDLFASSDEGIPDNVIAELIPIFNKRWKDFIDCGPTDIYFTAFFLDPRKCIHCHTLATTELLQGIPNPESSRILMESQVLRIRSLSRDPPRERRRRRQRPRQKRHQSQHTPRRYIPFPFPKHINASRISFRLSLKLRSYSSIQRTLHSPCFMSSC